MASASTRAEMETAYLRRLNVEQRLRYGLASHALYMVYQPQVNDAGETIGLGFGALAG